MTSKRKFYKSVIELTILSEEIIPWDEYELSDIGYAITDGDCSGMMHQTKFEELNGKQAADELIAQGSDPGFFCLDEDGNDDDDGGDDNE